MVLQEQLLEDSVDIEQMIQRGKLAKQEVTTAEASNLLAHTLQWIASALSAHLLLANCSVLLTIANVFGKRKLCDGTASDIIAQHLTHKLLSVTFTLALSVLFLSCSLSTKDWHKGLGAACVSCSHICEGRALVTSD